MLKLEYIDLFTRSRLKPQTRFFSQPISLSILVNSDFSVLVWPFPAMEITFELTWVVGEDAALSKLTA